MVNRSSWGMRASHGPMGVAVGVGEGDGVMVGVTVGSSVAVGSWTTGVALATAVPSFTVGGGRVGTAVANPVGAAVGRGGREAAVFSPQPVNKNRPKMVPSQSVRCFFIAADCTKSREK